MSVGTAIFLASIVLGTVLLYGFTKDRWRWARVVRIAFIVLFAFVGLGGIAGGVLIYLNSQPQPVAPFTSLWGITLGDAERDVVFRKGQPKTTCYHANERKSLWYFIAGYSGQKESWIEVALDKNLGVTSIMFYGDLSKAEQEIGKAVFEGESSSSVIARWGEPDRVTDGKSLTGRSYYWDRYNLVVAFEQDAADIIIVRSNSAPKNTSAEKPKVSCIPTKVE